MNHMEQYWSTLEEAPFSYKRAPPMAHLLDLFVAYCLCLHFQDHIKLDELGRTWLVAHIFEEAVISITS
jgi:hypothetical protein